ncbi:MAG: twin transmembrane helix small protein [Paracoccus sp. (in: a-proteobacteria)]
MKDDPLFFVVAIAVLAVAVILMVGIGGFARGGEWNRKHGNQMMRWRIIAQAIAIALIMLFIWLRG